MSNYTAAIDEFRQMLADTKVDKRASRKKVLGNIDGTNTKFRTYDKRIIESTFEVFNGNDQIDASLDDAIAGEFTIDPAPDKNSRIEASYYWQWWTDDQVKNFLNKGAEQTGQWTDNLIPDNAYLSINPGLKSAALYFAASMAEDSLVTYMQNRRHSQEFLIEQDNSKDSDWGAVLDAMRRTSKEWYERAVKMRDDFWKRLGQRNKPSFGYKMGATRNYGPRR